MIRLYAGTSPNVQKIYLALEEMGLPYEAEPVDVFGGAQFSDAFLKVNPVAKVPAIVDSDGPGGKPLTLFESGAILIYLADKTGKFLSKDPAIRAHTLQWMMVQMTGIGPMFGQFVHFSRFAPKPAHEYSVNRYRTQTVRFLEAIEGRLTDSAYLGGSEYSIADMATYPWTRAVPALLGAESAAKFPKVAAWTARIGERPGTKRMLAAIEELRAKLTGFDKAHPETLDRVFGRGTHTAA
ncbi:MAG TPA: glutathione S-transferase N-terminal domain-containing protein [Stellaceae bacterium]|nr:glutathione S-transferase N-terminal domain-containing protein [Stellaceae bacterium]